MRDLTGLQKFYTEEELMKHFGTLNPTLEQRTDYFDGLWFLFGVENELEVNDLQTPESMNRSEFISMLRRKYGPFNIVRRGLRIRFRIQEDALYVRLAYSRV